MDTEAAIIRVEVRLRASRVWVPAFAATYSGTTTKPAEKAGEVWHVTEEDASFSVRSYALARSVELVRPGSFSRELTCIQDDELWRVLMSERAATGEWKDFARYTLRDRRSIGDGDDDVALLVLRLNSFLRLRPSYSEGRRPGRIRKHCVVGGVDGTRTRGLRRDRRKS
jgi:hypothetical protein